MNPAEIDALVASVQAAKATGPAAGTPASTEAVADPNATPAPAPPQLAEFERLASTNSEVPLSMLFSLTLPISIELGRTNMSVQEILRLGRGSVIQLDRLAGAPDRHLRRRPPLRRGRGGGARRAFRRARLAHPRARRRLGAGRRLMSSPRAAARHPSTT